jgi:hypothetical protein
MDLGIESFNNKTNEDFYPIGPRLSKMLWAMGYT